MTWGALLLTILPVGEPIRDTVNVIERNLVYDHKAQQTFDQWIWWNGTADLGELRAWRLVHPPYRVERDFERGGWVLRFWDGDIFREVRAPTYRVIHSQYDREVHDRDFLPKHERRGLTQEKQEN
jgi:hypothetical protein